MTAPWEQILQAAIDAPRSACGDVCREVLVRGYAMLGIEAHVTTEPPIVPPRYEPLDMRCPHGRLWYAEPTSEQIAAWAEDGVL